MSLDVEGTIMEIKEALAEIAAELRGLRHTVDKLEGRLDALEKAPAKRWDTAVYAVISALVGAGITYFISH